MIDKKKKGGGKLGVGEKKMGERLAGQKKGDWSLWCKRKGADWSEACW